MARKNIIPESFSEGGKEKRVTTFASHRTVVMPRTGVAWVLNFWFFKWRVWYNLVQKLWGREAWTRARGSHCSSQSTPPPILGFCFLVCNMKSGQYCLQKHFQLPQSMTYDEMGSIFLHTPPLLLLTQRTTFKETEIYWKQPQDFLGLGLLFSLLDDI